MVTAADAELSDRLASGVEVDVDVARVVPNPILGAFTVTDTA